MSLQNNIWRNTFFLFGFSFLMLDASNPSSRAYILSAPTPCNDSICNTFSGLLLSHNGRNEILCFESYEEGYIIAGIANDRPYLAQLDCKLNIEWEYSFGNCQNFQIETLFIYRDHMYLSMQAQDNRSIRVVSFFIPDRDIIFSTKYEHSSTVNIQSILPGFTGQANNIINLYLLGETHNINGRCEGQFLSLHKNNGDIYRENTASLGGCESYSNSIIVNQPNPVNQNKQDYITSVGSFTTAGGGEEKMRVSLTESSGNGRQVWSNLYNISINDNARQYGSVVTDNGIQYAIAGYGDYNGTSLINVELFFNLIDHDGNVLSHKSYNISGNSHERVSDLIYHENGYYLIGNNNLTDGSSKVYILDLDKNGNLMEAFALTQDVGNFVRDVKIIDEKLFLAGSKGTNQNQMFLISLPLPLQVGDQCELLENIDATSKERTLYQRSIQLEYDLSNIDDGEFQVQEQNIELAKDSICFISCEEICGNGIDDNFDGLVDCEDPFFQDSCCCLPLLEFTESHFLCDGNSVFIDGTEYDMPGIYEIEYPTLEDECDTTKIILIETANSQFIENELTICEGENYIVGDSIYNSTGEYINAFKATNTCDSIVVTRLTVNTNTASTSTLEIEFCEGLVTTINDQVIESLGEQIQTLTNSVGCDSLVTINAIQANIYIPNTFTLGSNDQNSEFKVFSTCHFNFFELRIYDRWGNLVFFSEDITQAWSGLLNNKRVEQGVYTYTVNYGSLNTESRAFKSGSVVVLK